MTIARTLTYARKPVRVLVDYDGAWLAATDLYRLFGRSTNRHALARMAPEHLRLLPFPAPEAVVRLTAVSPLGALTIAKEAPIPGCQMLDAWLRRNCGELADEFGFLPPPLSLLADGTLPVKPKPLNDNYMPWHELRGRSLPSRRPADLNSPALFDEDPSLPPHDPAVGSQSIQDLMAAGELAMSKSPILRSPVYPNH